MPRKKISSRRPATTTTRRAVARKPKRNDAVYVTLRGLADQRRIEFELDDSLQEAAMRWSYVLRNRRRWTSRGAAFDRQREEVQQLVRQMGLSANDLADIAEATLVEVSIPFLGERRGWEQRIFPWEFMLAAATRERRLASAGHDFTIVRQLRRPAEEERQRAALLYVQSAPTRALREVYDFEAERSLVQRAAATNGLPFVELINPTLAQLKAAVRSRRPRMIHLAGFDTHQGRTLLARGRDAATEGADDRSVKDGYLLSDGGDGWVAVEADDLAGALTQGGATPDLVSCNIYYSAPRTAALCVAKGARSAIGFQDTFDDALSEVFYSTFYRAWQLSAGNPASAFCYAMKQVRAQGRRLTGTGVVLWGAESIADRPKLGKKLVSVQELTKDWTNASTRTVTAETARADLKVSVGPVPQLNYSILHNNRPLFAEFKIAKTSDQIGAVDGIEVNVELHVGRDSYPYRQQVSIPATQPSLDIAPEIRISLASTLNRAVRESVHTSLFVEVSYEKVVLFRETRRVTLLPVDEWQDSDANRKWLPSFVLPRDPAVSRVIHLSQRYLQALVDDPTAGFDGYQSVIELPNKRKRFDCTGVDKQVLAIWCALLYETPLAYINPPPTFTDSSQRLRSPSEVIEGGRGTCIDLALLIASCLEYVEIYPAVILLSDHAFPCYWRSEEYFEDFRVVRSAATDQDTGPDAVKGGAASQQIDSWYFEKPHFYEVAGEIAAGRLVPIEATGLCWRYSFAQALEEGAKNLSSRRRFDSMLDIRTAREDEDSPVTPLPLLRIEA